MTAPREGSAIGGRSHGPPPQKDVFISYAHADADWVRVLARNLYQSDLDVFFDEWDIGLGDTLVHRIDDGIASVPAGVIVLSEAALKSLWVRGEYAAIMKQVVKARNG